MSLLRRLATGLRALAALALEAATPSPPTRAGLELLWVATTPNVKTGPLPTAYVGRTREETEASCAGCALRDGRCYAWSGATGTIGVGRAQRRAAADPARYSLESALERRDRRARAVRVAALGDPARADRAELLAAERAVRAEGLSWLAYTHHWRTDGRGLEDHALASCDSLAQADEAAAAGWTVSAVAPWDTDARQVETPAGLRLVVCPALRDLAVTCNECRLCDPAHAVWKTGRLAGVAFPEHGRRVNAIAKRLGRALPNVGAQRPWRGST